MENSKKSFRSNVDCLSDELSDFRDWLEEKLYPQLTYCITDDLIKEYIKSKNDKHL